MLELVFRMGKNADCDLYFARGVLTRISLAAVLLALFTGCGAGDFAGEWRGTREVIGAVEVVRNPGAPLLKAEEVAVELLWATPDESGAAPPDNAVWAQPRSIRRSDSQVFMLDPMEHRIYTLRADDGRWLRTIGRQGGGPGELDNPYGIAVMDGELVVGSNGKKLSFDLFAADGGYLRSVRVGAMSFGLDPLTDGRVLSNTMTVGSGGSIHGGWRLYRLDGASGSADTIAPWPTSVALPGAEAKGGLLECMRTGTAGAQIIRSACAVPHLQLLDTEGRLLREFLVDRAPDLVTDAEREAEVEQVRETMTRTPGMPPAMIQLQMQVARDKSRIRTSFSEVRQDPATGIFALWEQNPQLLGSGPAKLHLFSNDGIYLAELSFARAWVDFDLVGSTLFALERDPETDLARAVAYRIELPERVGGLE